jgi:hypothetical protein
LGIAEATRAKKMERPTTAGDVVVSLIYFNTKMKSSFQRSFVFRKRIQTPPTYIRQQDLAKQLDAQIRWKQDEERTEKQEKDFVERLEQIQLAEAYVQKQKISL